MKLDHGNRSVIITNPKIYDFLLNNDGYMNEMELILERICSMFDYNKLFNGRQQIDVIYDKLKTDIKNIKSDIIDNISNELQSNNVNNLQKIKDDLQYILESKSSSISSAMYSFIDTKLTNCFIGFKDELKGFNHEDVIMTTLQNLQNTQNELNRDIKSTSPGEEVLKTMIDSLQNDIKSLTINKRSSSYKGQEGECQLFDLLESKLTSRNGYEVIDCHSEPHSLDILIKKSGYSDVRIDVKNHGGQSSKEDGRIRTAEVKRFENDVLNCSSHGILVSLHSPICGKDGMNIERLPNGKLTVYLSNNEYNVNVICEMLQIFHFIDDFCSQTDTNNDLHLSTDVVQKMNDIIKETEKRIYELKNNLEQSLKIVSNIKFDMINSLLRGQQLKELVTDDKAQKQCGYCEKWFKVGKGGYLKHLKTCSEKPRLETIAVES